MCKELLIHNIDKIHTTEMGLKRIAKNLNIKEEEALLFCRKKIFGKECVAYKKGKNFYCRSGNVVITINSHSYTIITAHILSE